ncbi:MAG TPA: Pr6Pr family membrane protein [Pseudonocardiaceae bacterium]|jgi:hypothetical protein
MRTEGAGRWLVGGYRTVFAVSAAIALGWQARDAAATGALGNYFSFFTIESNILGTVVLAWGGLALLAGWRGAPDVLRGSAVVYLVITGVVYATLLAELPGEQPNSWVNTVVHRIMPIVLVLDWLLAPPARPPRLPRAWWWLVFPLAFCAYTLVRGPFVDWYPYPFLDPRPHGYGHVAVGVVGIAVGFVVTTLLVWWAGSALSRRGQRVTALP